ncbi:MAG: sigma-70 family RNA polymerase sigma factor [bacterium]|nr:sigma-70 family RNA polymerase sigma factor [bacterium]
MNRLDQELIVNYLNGDVESLEILIQRYLKPVYRFVYQYVGNVEDAEDITQEAFVKAWRNLQRFDRTKNFKTWIFAIAKNTAIDFLKKKKTIPFSAFSARNGENEAGESTFAETLADSLPLPDEMLVRRDARYMLARAMEKLSYEYKMVILLRSMRELTFREIAESLGEPLHTVKSRYRRGLVLLKNILRAEI